MFWSVAHMRGRRFASMIEHCKWDHRERKVQHLKAYKDVLDGGFICVVTTNDSERRAVLGSLDAKRKL
jgi:hypothetical protein